MKPAARSSGAYDGGAWNEKQVELAAAALRRPALGQRPLEVAETTSPVRSRLTERKYDSAGPATIAMSPAKANRTTVRRRRRRDTRGRARERAPQASAASLRARLRMGGVGEFAKLARDEIGSLFSDVHRMVADALQGARGDQHTQAPFPLPGTELEHLLDGGPVRPVDQLVELDEGVARAASRAAKERRATWIISSARAAISTRLDDLVVALRVGDELRQLGDRHAVVGHPLEMEVHVQDREHEPEVAGDGRLPGEQRLDALLDRDIAGIDVVVECDHLFRELEVALDERANRRAQRADDELALLLERLLELGRAPR